MGRGASAKLTVAAVFALLAAPAAASAGMTVTPLGAGVTAADLAQRLAGPGVSVSNVTYTGSAPASGSFEDCCAAVGFNEGILLTSGTAADAPGPNDSDGTSTSNGAPGDSALDALAGAPTSNAAVLEFDFVPSAGTVSLRYVFGSEEYTEFIGSYNDVFGFFVNGENCALTPDDQPVSVNTINNGKPNGSGGPNAALYRNNDPSDGGATIDIEYDGITTVLTCTASVTPGETNHMKLALGDASDSSLDSAVFLESDSFETPACSNGADDDGDGKTDHPADPGCTSASDDDEFNAPPPAPACSDGVDNDGDGKTDHPADPGCTSPSDVDEFNVPAPACSDGGDNDGDGKTDHPADPGCTSPSDTNEDSSAPACSNGSDDDGDGRVDGADPGCATPGDSDENDFQQGSTQCSDGKDNDGDRDIDLADPGCETITDNSESGESRPSGGTGQGGTGGGTGSGTGGGTESSGRAGEAGGGTLPAPQQGRTANIAPTTTGTIRVRLPGTSEFIDLRDARQVPMGTIIDASQGHVLLTSAADANGTTQTGEFFDGYFRISQQAGQALTDLRLWGPLESCSAKSAKSSAKRRRGRRLWGRAKGRFRTRGRRSAATVRGTIWMVADRCDGTTLSKVIDGTIDVSDFGRGTVATVTAPGRYVATRR